MENLDRIVLLFGKAYKWIRDENTGRLRLWRLRELTPEEVPPRCPNCGGNGELPPPMESLVCQECGGTGSLLEDGSDG